MKKRKHRHSKLIDELGGTAQVARDCGVTQSCVSQWRRRGIPLGSFKYLQLLKPEIFATRG